ncbi:DNA ligase 4 [Chironomus tepperi]|uniref:DNA ligase 4 n=1 Tax=Chironomus tepperi TaxID=113505 RepID=UPI00391F640E
MCVNMSFMDVIHFCDVTEMLDKCVEARNTIKKQNILKKFITEIVKYQQGYKCQNPSHDMSLYPLIRIILSNEERERAYGIQEKTLRKILIKSIKINGPDARKIVQCNENELADKVYEVVSSRNSRSSKLTVHQVDTLLNNLCENQTQKYQQTQFEYLFLNGSATDFKWIVKIILKNMNLKININKFLTHYHPLALLLFEKFPHLSKVCEIIDNNNAEREARDKVEPFVPIRPMLSQKFSSDMNGMINTTAFYQEIKFDGERFQIHMENGVYKYFSRNGYDFSEAFNITLSPLIKFKTVVHSIILDGEMLIWDRTNSRFVSKGESEIDVKKLKDPNSNLRPCYCAFDVLYVNGVSYIDYPLSRRCSILSSLIENQTGIFIKTEPIRIRDIDHLVSLFNAAMENEEEGIILKRLDTNYMPGSREKGGWYKVKADYFDGDLVTEFDCVIIGGNYQNRYKKDYLLKYQVGAVEKLEDGLFNVYSIGEINLGLSRENRKKLNAKLAPFMIDYDNRREIKFEKGQVFFGKSRPDVFIPPHKSIVLQIKASELAPSSEYYTNYTFRFPRISDVRYDKFWDDSVTLKEFQEYFKTDNNNDDRRVRKINKRKVHKDDLVSPTKKKKLAASRSAIEMFCHDSGDDGEIEPIDNVLEGHEFCVLCSAPFKPSVRELKLLLRLHGASLTEFPRKNKTYAIVAGELTNSVTVYKNDYNIIKVEWLVANFPKDSTLDHCPELTPSDYHFMNEATMMKLLEKFDEYGDSYTKPFNSPEDAKEFLQKLDENENVEKEVILNFEEELFKDANSPNPNYFRNYAGYFHDEENETNLLYNIAKFLFEFRGGRVSNTLHKKCFVFVDPDVCKREDHKEFDNYRLCDYNFILNSNDARKLLDIRGFMF